MKHQFPEVHWKQSSTNMPKPMHILSIFFNSLIKTS
jgi:hypothetical protein